MILFKRKRHIINWNIYFINNQLFVYQIITLGKYYRNINWMLQHTRPSSFCFSFVLIHLIMKSDIENPTSLLDNGQHSINNITDAVTMSFTKSDHFNKPVTKTNWYSNYFMKRNGVATKLCKRCENGRASVRSKREQYTEMFSAVEGTFAKVCF